MLTTLLPGAGLPPKRPEDVDNSSPVESIHERPLHLGSQRVRRATHDIVIVGGGHNGLTAAAYLARAGKSVIVLERLDDVGGAAVSAQAFPGVEARLSRYSYLVSLLPQRIIDDLGLDIRLARRRYSSYTPVPGDADGAGLLIDNTDDGGDRRILRPHRRGGRRSGLRVGLPQHRRTGPGALADGDRAAAHPLRGQGARRRRRAVGCAHRASDRRASSSPASQSDLVRGVVATDALIGTFASRQRPRPRPEPLLPVPRDRQGTGDWDVPVGGMGAVTGELARVAREAGARIVTGAEVTAHRPRRHPSSTSATATNAVSSARTCSSTSPRTCSTGCSASQPEPPAGRRPRAPRSRSTCCWNASPGSATRPSTRRRRSAGPSTSTRRYSQLEEAYYGHEPRRRCPISSRARSTATR